MSTFDNTISENRNNQEQRDLAAILESKNISSSIGFCVIILPFLVITTILFTGFFLADKSKVIPLVTATLLAVSTPIVLISIRHFVRLGRLKLINLFEKSFQGVDWKKIASFESIKAKYLTDIPGVKENTIDLNLLPSLPFSLPTDWMLFLCALPFMIFSWLAFYLFFAPLELLAQNHQVNTSLLIGDNDTKSLQIISAIALSSFAGAFFYSMNLFIRSISSFDMSPVTFLRAFVQVVFASVLAIVIWHAANQIVSILPNFVYDSLPVNSRATNSKEFWILFAFALGFLPDGAIQLILKKSGLDFKGSNMKVAALFPSTPLSVIDGIDYFTSFRLQEANIFDVQNLAAYNPIMLFVETPFSVYQTIDWAAQAQLCTVVGAERFLLLRSLNIRTIFDLERAVLGIRSPENLKRKIGGIIFSECLSHRRVREYLQIPKSDTDILDASLGLDAAEALPKWVNIEAIGYIVRVMIDDLHVHRLRQIWQSISDALGSNSEYLEHVEKFKDE